MSSRAKGLFKWNKYKRKHSLSGSDLDLEAGKAIPSPSESDNPEDEKQKKKKKSWWQRFKGGATKPFKAAGKKLKGLKGKKK